MTGDDPEADVAYYRKWIAPEIKRLAGSSDEDEQLMAKSVMEKAYNAVKENSVIRESLILNGRFMTFTNQVRQLEAQLEGLDNPAHRAQVIGQMATLQSSWTMSFSQRRKQVLAAGITDEQLLSDGRATESELNVMVNKYAGELKQATGGQGQGGQGRTAFGVPQGPPGARTAAQPVAGGRYSPQYQQQPQYQQPPQYQQQPQQPFPMNRAAGVPAQFNTNVLRPMGR